MKKLLFTIFLLIFTAFTNAQPENIYQLYKTKANNIYKQMTLDEKIGQLLIPSYVLLANSISKDGKECRNTLNNYYANNTQIIKACGLNQIAKYHLGAVLTGGGPYFNAPTLNNWLALNHLANSQHRIGNPSDPVLLIGNDAVHGNSHLQGAVIFPHNIGLGVTHDPALIFNIGLLVGQDSLASGFNWIFMPTVAVAQDLRWGRTYESFSADPQLVKILTFSYVNGFQQIHNQHLQGPLATAKHFLGDGATRYGLDEGDDVYAGNQNNFWNINGLGYEGAINANVATIMVSYNAIDDADTHNQTRMHFGGRWNIINQLKNQGIIGSNGKNYPFNGFVVSDWNGPTRAAFFYDRYHLHLTLPQIMAKSINSGIDMIMLGQGDTTNPFDPKSKPNFTNVRQVFDAIKTAYQDQLISKQKLKDAVTRVLSVKLAMTSRAPNHYAELQKKERKLALKAAEESLVLLKNDHIIPLHVKLIKNIILLGDTNNLGLQNGGWTINWQGQEGKQYFTGKDKTSSGAITLMEGIKNITQLNHVKIYTIKNMTNRLPVSFNKKDTIVIVLLSEVPYAEFMGDIGNPFEKDAWYELGATNGYNNYLGLPQNRFLGLQFNSVEAQVIHQLKEKGIKTISVVYSGRPIILSKGGKAAPLTNSDAVIAAFLPGTLGGKAIANALFGEYRFRSAANSNSNTLTFPWPENEEQINDHFKKGSLFPIGFGLAD